MRPAGSALIELDAPNKKEDITEIRPKQIQYNPSGPSGPSGRYYSTPADCGYDNNQSPVYEDQSTVYDYSPPATSDTQYHPTTFAPPYLPPYSTDQSSTSSSCK